MLVTALFGAGLALAMVQGALAAPVPVALGALAQVWLARHILSTTDRRTVAPALVAAFALRVAAAGIISYGAVALGRGETVVGDDKNYADLAWGVVQWLHGTPEEPFTPPTWHGGDYLLGTFVYLEIAIFWLFGRQVVMLELVNAVFAGMTILFVYDLVRRVHDRRAAIVAAWVVALWPSLVVWSALNLKDTLALLIITAALWLIRRYQEVPRARFLIAILLVLVPLESTRRYLYLGFAALLPMVVALSPDWALGARARRTAAALAVTAFLLVTASRAGPGVPTSGLSGLEATRSAMAAGARTAYAEPKAVIAKEGDTFVVVDVTPVAPTTVPAPTPIPAPGPEPTIAPTPMPTPRVVVVPPGTRIVLASATPAVLAAAAPTTVPSTGQPRAAGQTTRTSEPSSTPPGAIMTTTHPTTATTSAPSTPQPTASARPGPTTPAPVTPGPTAAAASGAPLAGQLVVVVQAGDIVVVGDPQTTPGPPERRRTLSLQSRNAVNEADIVASTGSSDVLQLTRTLAYVPKGATYALFAPFPWAIERPADALTVPEMLAWYLLLALAPFACWRTRRRWAVLAPTALFTAGVLGILVLTEGNFGTLYRHRAMVIPSMVALAAPALADLGARMVRRLRSGSS